MRAEGKETGRDSQLIELVSKEQIKPRGEKVTKESDE
jgi:hypothetical protein